MHKRICKYKENRQSWTETAAYSSDCCLPILFMIKESWKQPTCLNNWTLMPQCLEHHALGCSKLISERFLMA